ncbi:MAG: ZIP family metal transporter [Bdellovibrionota bacterium]
MPLLSEQVRRHSKTVFLAGTGAMAGICFFDLLPDVYELGGNPSLALVGVVWLAYSALHFFHLGHHHHGLDGPESEESTPGAFYFFFVSLFIHCLSSGMLMAVSSQLSARIANTVFAALMAHKGYEALAFASILVVQRATRIWKAVMLALYTLSVPIGVALTVALTDRISQSTAILLSSIAVGTLLGCLVLDFLIPSIQHLRGRKVQILWLVGGLLLTRLFMFSGVR